jgi:hypothetical protein
MAKTAKEVLNDLRGLVVDSPLAAMLSGQVYMQGQRPRDSRKEDLILIFTAGTAEQVQSGFVTLNIFVPDISIYEDGTLTEDNRRTQQVETVAQEWVDTLTAANSDYLWRLHGIIDTHPDESIQQHFVSVSLRFRYFGSDL